jgi:hypothetical protein
MELHLGFDGIRSSRKELRRWLGIILPLRKGAGKHNMSKTTRICVCRFNDHVVLKRADSGLLCPKKETFTVIKMIFPLNTSIWFGDVAMSDCRRLLIGG